MTDPDLVATIGEKLRVAARVHPERDAYVMSAQRLTYGELDHAADALAALLVANGVRPGDRVALVLPNGVDIPKWYLAGARAGAITTAVNLRLAVAERTEILAHADPTVVVAAGDIEVAPGRHLVLDAGEIDPESIDVRSVALPPVSAVDPVCIVWTSGTTGRPKGAVYDHVAQAEISAGMGDLAAAGDRRLFVLPMPHVGYMTRVWDDFHKGVSTIFADDPWSARRTLELVAAERITMMTGVPTQWQMLLDEPGFDDVDWSNLRRCGIGGAAIPPQLVRRMRNRLGVPVVARYTTTEAGISTGTLVTDEPEVTATTVGVASPVVDLRIVDPDTDEPVARGQVGEVRTRSRAMFRGYWRDPDQTSAVFDEAGYLRTADLGMIGADGNLRIVGRRSDMYVRGGYNVYPGEVEAVLVDHPAVSEAAIVGYPDDRLGERGCAFVVPTTAATPPDLEELRGWCRTRIADYKLPERLEIVEALPLTAMRKVDKVALAARL